MQEDYVGINSKYAFQDKNELIDKIKTKIDNFRGQVIYAKNVRKTSSSNIIRKLLVDNPLVFTKEKSSLFSNDSFDKYLEDNKVIELEIVGIDGNCCVKNTALDGIKNGYKVYIDLSCVGAINKIRFEKTLAKLKINSVFIYN